MTPTTLLRWKSKMRAASRLLDDLGRQPSAERDMAMDAYLDASEARAKLTQAAWDARRNRRVTARLDASLSAMQIEHDEGRIGDIPVSVTGLNTSMEHAA